MFCLEFGPIFLQGAASRAQGMSYDHTTVIIPHPIRTAKSSTVGPNQYCGGGPRGNLGCRRASFYFFFLIIIDFFFIIEFFFFKCFAWNLALFPGWSTARRAQGMSYDHTTVIIPHPIRTAKSSTVGPNQYCGGGPRGNLGCRRASFYFFFFVFSNVLP